MLCTSKSKTAHFCSVSHQALQHCKHAEPPSLLPCLLAAFACHSEELSALLELLLLPAAEQGAWMLQWIWTTLYQVCLSCKSLWACAPFWSSWSALLT